MTTERPINFNAEMVRAILEGRKTVTRRPIKNQVGDSINCGDGCYIPLPTCERVAHLHLNSILSLCPFGVPGDRLWVRETWSVGKIFNDIPPGDLYKPTEEDMLTVDYAADPKRVWVENQGRWRPSTHMPRWASRITLEVTGVRVERVQDISNEDAWREGVSNSHEYDCPAIFKAAWDSIYAAKGFGWNANPWVWVVEFKRVEGEK